LVVILELADLGERFLYPIRRMIFIDKDNLFFQRFFVERFSQVIFEFY
jgi:hypothetical protein